MNDLKLKFIIVEVEFFGGKMTASIGGDNHGQYNTREDAVEALKKCRSMCGGFIIMECLCQDWPKDML